MSVKFKLYKLSPKSPKKFKAVSDRCSVKFGANGYSDMTIHKSPERQRRYIQRHKRNENWSKNGICTPGWWSRYLLWNKPSLKQSIQDINRNGLVYVQY